MFVLINVFSSDCTAPYIASIQKFNTITIAQKAMETLSKRAYRKYYETWSQNDGMNEDTEPHYESDSHSAYIIGYDYHDFWEIKEI